MNIPLKELTIDSPELLSHIAANTDLPARCADNEYFADCCFSEIHEHAETCMSYDCIGAYEEPFEVRVREYQGIFFVQAAEFDDRGFFLDVNTAIDAAEDIAANFSGLQ